MFRVLCIVEGLVKVDENLMRCRVFFWGGGGGAMAKSLMNLCTMGVQKVSGKMMTSSPYFVN